MADPPPGMPPRIDDIVLTQVRQHLAAHAWLVVQEPQLTMCHTVGLTVHGLPELVVSQTGDVICQQLDRWAARSVSGELILGARVNVQDLELREHQYAIRRYDIDTRGGLWLPRALYGPQLVVREIDVRSCPCLPCRAET